MTIHENRYAFFVLNLEIDSENQTNNYIEKVEDSTDLILHAMNVKDTLYKFRQKDNKQLLYLFKTDLRKRKGQLVKLANKFLPENQFYTAGSLTKNEFSTRLGQIQKNNKFQLEIKPLTTSDYEGNDLKIFQDKTKWHPWQTFLYNMLFDEENKIKEPHPRHIISIIDEQGNSGKSSFFKWLFYNHPLEIGRIGYGTTTQLRSSITNIGKKPIYIIDLARSKGKYDREEDLLSVLEDLKSGFITNAMYGSGKTLLMPPPHIIVSSNYQFNYDLLSNDRWMVYKLNNKYKLENIPIRKLKLVSMAKK